MEGEGARAEGARAPVTLRFLCASSWSLAYDGAGACTDRVSLSIWMRLMLAQCFPDRYWYSRGYPYPLGLMNGTDTVGNGEACIPIGLSVHAPRTAQASPKASPAKCRSCGARGVWPGGGTAGAGHTHAGHTHAGPAFRRCGPGPWAIWWSGYCYWTWPVCLCHFRAIDVDLWQRPTPPRSAL